MKFIDLSYLVTSAISWGPLIWAFKFENICYSTFFGTYLYNYFLPNWGGKTRKITEMKKENEPLNYQGK